LFRADYVLLVEAGSPVMGRKMIVQNECALAVNQGGEAADKNGFR